MRTSNSIIIIIKHILNYSFSKGLSSFEFRDASKRHSIMKFNTKVDLSTITKV